MIGGAATDWNASHATRGADLTGITDQRTGIVSIWFRLDGSDSTNIRMLDSTRFRVERAGPNIIQIFGADSGGSTVLLIGTTGTFTAGASWVHLLASWRLDTSVEQIYINDVSDVSVTTSVNNPIDYTTGNYAFAGSTAGANKFDGCLAEVFFHNTFLDLSVVGNRRLFRTAGGKPENLGADGSTPLGVQPLLYCPDGDPQINKGSGGNFALASGSIVPCSTSPA